MSLQDLERANSELKAKIQSIRAQLPKSTIPGHLTMDEVAELCGLDSETDARAMLGDHQSYSTDTSGRECIAADALDRALVHLADGQPLDGGFL